MGDILAMESHYATALAKQRKFKSAEPILRKTLAKQSRLFAKRHPMLLSTKAKLAGAYYGQEKFSQAHRAYSEALVEMTALVGPSHSYCVDLRAKAKDAFRRKAAKMMRKQQNRRLVKPTAGKWKWSPRPGH